MSARDSNTLREKGKGLQRSVLAAPNGRVHYNCSNQLREERAARADVEAERDKVAREHALCHQVPPRWWCGGVGVL